MEKMLKKEIISLYISLIFLSIAAIFGCSVPLFSNTIMFTGKKAAGFFILFGCSLFSTFIFKFFRFDVQVYLPFRLFHDCMPQMFFDLDDAVENGKITCERKAELVKKSHIILDLLYKNWIYGERFLVANKIFNLIILILICTKLFLIRTFCFSNMYGIAAFFLIFKTAWYHLISKHIYLSVKEWQKLRIFNYYKTEREIPAGLFI